MDMVPQALDKLQCTVKRLDTLLKVAANNKGVRAAVGAENERQASRDLEELELAFGCYFFKPGSNPLALTAEGHELAQITREFFNSLDEFNRRCRDLPQKISIAAGDSVVNWIILPALNFFLSEKRFANNSFFSVRQGGTKGIILLLHESQIDFAVVPENAPLEKKWKHETIGVYKYCICCSQTLLGKRLLNTDTLPKLDFALITDHWGLDFAEKARLGGIKLNVKIKCETFTHIASLVKSGSFAGILPLSTMSSFQNEPFLWFTPEFMGGTDRIIKLVWKQEGSHIKSHINEIAAPLLGQLRNELTKKQNCKPSKEI
jgi:LysR family transcriptional regulator, nitrogen assimilation regulatory protein